MDEITATFTEQRDTLAVIDREALEGFWTYYARTRDKDPRGYESFRRGRLSALATLRQLAELETLVGHERARAFLANAIARARAEQTEDPGP